MIKFCDGFDHYQVSNNGTLLKWDGVATQDNGSSYEVLPGDGRPSLSDTNTGGAKFTGGNGFGGGNLPWAYFIKNANSNLQTGVVGFAFKYPAVGAQDCGIICFQDGSSSQVSLVLSTSGQLYVTRGYSTGTVLATSINALSVNVWYYVEIKVKVDPAVGTVEVRVNGSNVGWINITGQNTRATANSYFTRFLCGNMSVNASNGIFSATTQFDDLVFMDTTGTYNKDFIGDVRVNGRLANGNGTLNQWTRTVAAWPSATAVKVGTQILDSNGNIQKVTSTSGTGTTGGSAPSWNATTGLTTTDNAGANQVVWTNRGAAADWLAISETTPDSDYSYLSDATVGDQSRFVYPAISGSSVNAVMAWLFSDKDDAGSRALRAVTKSGAAVGDNGSDLVMGATYTYQGGLFETDPDTALPWTIAAVNAAEFGAKVIS
jgi:hypothetical protein